MSYIITHSTSCHCVLRRGTLFGLTSNVRQDIFNITLIVFGWRKKVSILWGNFHSRVGGMLLSNVIVHITFSATHQTFNSRTASIRVWTNIIKDWQSHVYLFWRKLKTLFSTYHWIFHFETAVKCASSNVISFLQKCCHRHIFREPGLEIFLAVSHHNIKKCWKYKTCWK